MPDQRSLPLWAGRTLALVGILLVALNLRTAVAAISPIADQISVDIPLSSVAFGVLGSLPPIAFALSGIIAPLVARRIGVDGSIALAAAAMVIGNVVRGLADSYTVLLLGSVIALAGMGFGNILLPPAVKRYFPDRVGLVTTAYVTLLSISTAGPAVLAAPVADTAGWQVSLGMWAIVAFAALVPWIFLLLRDRAARAASVRTATASADGDAEPIDDIVEAPEPAMLGHLLRSRVAWALAIAFAASSLNAYAAFAWLPALLRDISGVDAVSAGLLLAIYGLVGLPTALVMPILASKLHNVGPLFYLAVGCYVAGYLGFLLAPAAAPLLWVILVGLGPLLFPVCLVLINLRTRSHHTSIALSGFVQGIGYTMGSLGPLLVGLLHDASGGWTVPLLFLLCTGLVATVSGLLMTKPVFVEDEIARRA